MSNSDREKAPSLDSTVQKPQPTLDVAFGDFRSSVDRELTHLSEKTSAIQTALTVSEQEKRSSIEEIKSQLQLKVEEAAELARKVELLDQEVKFLREQERFFIMQLEDKEKKIRTMEDTFKKASEDANGEVNENVVVMGAAKVARSEEANEPRVVVGVQTGSKSMEVANTAVTPSKIQILNEKTGESVPDGVADKSAAAVRGACATGESEVEKNTTNREERPTSTSTPGKPNPSVVCEQMIVANDSDDENDTFEEIMDVADDPDYSPGKKLEPKSYGCDQCGRSYSSKIILSNHKKVDCGKPKLECKKCSRSFKPSTLPKHLQRDNCIPKNELRCKNCIFVARDSKGLKIHRKSCKQEKKDAQLVQDK